MEPNKLQMFVFSTTFFYIKHVCIIIFYFIFFIYFVLLYIIFFSHI